MRPRIHVITLAVSDLGRALEFYRDGLGLESAGVIGTEFAGDETNPAGAVAMFQRSFPLGDDVIERCGRAHPIRQLVESLPIRRRDALLQRVRHRPEPRA
jgi:catechol 2,3-dioxygenase-like lactoylglutathione lyase family enzyme